MKRLALGWMLVSGACASPTEPDLGGMPMHTVRLMGDAVFTARSERRHDSLFVLLTIRNPGQSPANIRFGACSFAVQGVGPLGATWDNRISRNAGCIDIGYSLDLGAGQSHERRIYRAPIQNLRASRPPGPYAISVYYRESAVLRRLHAGSAQL